MIINELISNHEFIRDVNCKKFKEVMKNGIRLKSINIDLFPSQDKHFMLLSRLTEKNVVVLNDNVNFILRKTDKYSTYIMNILFSEMENIIYKEIYNGCYEFMFEIKNICFKMLLLSK